MTLSKEPKKSIAVEKSSVLVSGDCTLRSTPDVYSFTAPNGSITAIAGNLPFDTLRYTFINVIP
nr:hypothetical protein [Haemophilus parainfluenzae]